jgi:hypothetical protein
LLGTTQSGNVCLMTTGSSRVIYIHLLSVVQYACRWFHERLELVALDILTQEEKDERKGNQIVRSNLQVMAVMNPQQIEYARSFGGLLTSGFRVLHHHPCGRVFKSFLYADAQLKVLTVECEDRTFFGNNVAKVLVRH